jgi:hypothetical protein
VHNPSKNYDVDLIEKFPRVGESHLSTTIGSRRDILSQEEALQNDVVNTVSTGLRYRKIRRVRKIPRHQADLHRWRKL